MHSKPVKRRKPAPLLEGKNMFIRSISTRRLLVTLTVLCAVSVWFQPVALAGGGWPPAAEKSQKVMSPQLLPQVMSEPVQIQPILVKERTRAGQNQRVTQADTRVDVAQKEGAEKPFYSPSSMSKPGKLEFGVMGGEPLGLSAKLWLSPTRAIAAGLGWSMLDSDTSLQLHADYLFHNFDLLKPKSGSLPVYYGMGARFRFGEDSRFGFRVPIGVQYISASKTFSLFMEAGPVINFIPTADVDVNFGLGIRFFFF